MGDISNPGANVANYFSTADWNSANGNVTTVGSAGPLSDGYYGTADQGGNVREWNESLISGTFRGVRGGGFGSGSSELRASSRGVFGPSSGGDSTGFRVATVPEPSTAVLVVFAMLALAVYGWRRR